MKKKKDLRTSQFFGRIAARGWRKSSFFTYTWKYPVLRRWVISQISTTERIVLSIGCGSGELERDLSKANRLVVAIDISLQMLKVASQQGVRVLIQADARALPFAGACFDIVILLESIGYFDLPLVFRETKRVLKKGGRVLATAYPSHLVSDSLYKKCSLHEIIRHLRDVGFRIMDQRALAVKRNGVIEAISEDRSDLLYVLGQKRP
jgi:ubiquinone/menaquinone biosynthesis C-methylase UbiE